VLFVRVDRDGVGAVDADVVQPVDRIVTGAAGTDDDNPGGPELSSSSMLTSMSRFSASALSRAS